MSIAAKRLSRANENPNSLPSDSVWPTGVYMIWEKTSTPFEVPYVKAGQMVLDWSKIEPSRGTFNWSTLDTAINRFATGGKPFVLQLNSSQKPAWIYSQPGIKKIGTYSNGRYTWDIPNYWEPLYMTLLGEALEALAIHVRSHAKREWVLGVRATPNLIGNEMYDLNNPDADITDSATASTWTMAIAKYKYEEVMRLFKSTFMNGVDNIQTILRSLLFSNLNTNDAIKNELLGVNKGWLFGTNGTPDADLVAVDNLYYDWVKSGKTHGLYEALYGCSDFIHPLSWAYWRQLLELSRGVYFVATYGDDLDRSMTGTNIAEFQATFNFTNMYAGYQDKPAVSPGGFIAFRGTDNQPKGNYCNFITLHNADGSLGGDTATVRLGTTGSADSEVSIVGPNDQRFGRFARRTDVANSKRNFYLRIDNTFVSSLGANATVKVTYLDSGTSSWQLQWAGGSSSVTKTNTGRWKNTSFTVPKSGLNGSLTASSDLVLAVTTGTVDTTFHMVEVLR